MDNGLTPDEKNCLLNLAAAWDVFVAMPTKHPSDTHEFQSAIHNAQCLIALRVARRVNPDFWYQPEKQQQQYICERCGEKHYSLSGRCELCGNDWKRWAMKTGI